MPLHRRSNKEDYNNTRQNLNNKFGNEEKSQLHQPNRLSNWRRPSNFLGWIALQVVLLLFIATKVKSKTLFHLTIILLTAWVSFFPAFLILGVGIGIFDGKADLPHQKFIPLAVVATIIGNQLPTFLSSGMAASGMLIFGLASRPMPQKEDVKGEVKQDTQKRGMFHGPLGAVLAVLLLTAVLLTENFFIWVVSATYEPGQNLSKLPTPLQDNGQLILRYFFDSVLGLTKRDIVAVRNMVNVEWILVSGMGLSLVATEIQGTAMRRNLWSLALRGLFTMAIARSIRTISFLITVLPSQNPRCYFSHFPTPPKDWFSWLMVGFIPQANGGCNDLIISGHATVTSTLACVVTSVVGKPLFTTALWMFVAFDYMVEIYEGFHYSVDMWLGAILVNFIWTVLAPLEKPTNQEHGIAAKKFYPINETSQPDLLKYAIPVVGSYLQVNGIIPAGVANYTILVFVFSAIYQISTSGFQHYTQHCLFCLLYVALGIYL